MIGILAADVLRIDFAFSTARIMSVSAFVYRLGRGLLKAEGRVRFPYALPTPLLTHRINDSVSFNGFKNSQLLTCRPISAMSWDVVNLPVHLPNNQQTSIQIMATKIFDFMGVVGLADIFKRCRKTASANYHPHRRDFLDGNASAFASAQRGRAGGSFNLLALAFTPSQASGRKSCSGFPRRQGLWRPAGGARPVPRATQTCR